MERREQYDPEDIENLLHERSFDELLEEERAYVLRHLNGREEYEQMRALLRQVRDDERLHRPIEADGHVRENVLEAFRAQQRPQWRVWLNSIGGIFLPREGFAMWRPALAIAMLLVLFGVSFYMVRSPIAGTTERELAEVRQKKAEEPLPVKKPAVADTINTELKEEHNADTGSVVEDRSGQVPAPSAPVFVQDDGKFDGTAHVHTEATADPEIAVTAPEMQEDLASEEAERIEPASAHVVTEAEMMQNQSVANATGKVRTRSIEKDSAVAWKKEKAVYAGSAASRPVSQDSALLDLLSAGW